ERRGRAARRTGRWRARRPWRRAARRTRRARWVRRTRRRQPGWPRSLVLQLELQLSVRERSADRAGWPLARPARWWSDLRRAATAYGAVQRRPVLCRLRYQRERALHRKFQDSG